ncbi:MAG: hypothetical protein Q9190_002378 [Brigantiaea leucoxantha]
MNIPLSRRPWTNLSFLYPPFFPSVIPASRRLESSARRTKKRLGVKTDPTFTSSIPADQLQDHVIFNPPSSAPNPYHTPVAFLPPDDPRRTLLSQAHEHANPYLKSEKRLPPTVREPYEKKYHLKEADILEIKRLRKEDSFKWTRSKLAEKFQCSPLFIALVCEASQERKNQQREVLQQVKDRWGTKRRHAREDREKRRSMWGRDE